MTNLNIDFTGQIVLVTGATRGIGKAIADDFKSAGAEVISIGTKDVNFLDKDSTNYFLEQISSYDKIDILVNNAGINKINYQTEVKDEDYDNIMNVNLKAPFLLSREVSKLMKKNKYGRIVNIASIFGTSTRIQRSVYTSTKAGLIGLTKTLAAELARDNILVNSVSPGFTKTELTESILTDEDMKSLSSQIPLKRLGQPEEISKAVLFLSSSLNTFITGQDIIVDGGFINTVNV